MTKSWQKWVQECFKNKKLCYSARCLPNKNDKSCVECYENYVAKAITQKEGDNND